MYRLKLLFIYKCQVVSMLLIVITCSVISLLILFFFVFCIFCSCTMAYGGSQARGLIGAVATGLCQGHGNMGSEPRLSATYTTAQGNVGSLTH